MTEEEKTMSDDGTRSIELEVTVEATPEEAWEALTTGEGLERWFPLEARVEPGEEGGVWLSWGPGCEGEAPIHVWEPHERFGWTESYGEDESGRPIRVAVDFHIEGQGGSTVVRLVQSGLSASADWDEMYDALKDGWTYFLFNLGFHFRMHGGERRRMVWLRHPTELTRDEVWRRLMKARLVDGGEGADGPHILLADAQPARRVSSRTSHHYAAVLPDLNDSLWFVELEGRHVGFGLSVYAPTF